MIGVSFPDIVVSGEGDVALRDCQISPPVAGDMERNPVVDMYGIDIPQNSDALKYEMAYTQTWLTLRAWIRRAVHAEVFAKSLEVELEKARANR